MSSHTRSSHGVAGGALALLACTALAQAPRPAQPVPAQPGPPPGPAVQVPPPPAALLPPPEMLPTVELEPLLARVGRSADKKFLVSTRAAQQIYLGGVAANAVDYPTLLAILRSNGLVAIEIAGYMNVMPLSEARFTAPLVPTDDAALADDEWITRVIVTENVEAAQLIPVLRPLLPQEAHLAAFPPRSVIVMDRYGNVKRIEGVIRALDRAPR